MALARGLLRKPKLQVLNEAADALDPAPEQTVLDRLVSLGPRRTIVIVSHRPDSLLRCDRIVTMAEGGFT